MGGGRKGEAALLWLGRRWVERKTAERLTGAWEWSEWGAEKGGRKRALLLV